MTHTHSERERRTQTQTHNSLGKRMPVRLPFCPDGPAGTGQGTWKFPDFFWFFFFWFPPEFALSAFLIGAGRLATRFRWDSSSSALSRKLFALLRSGIVHATDELVAVYRLWWLPFLPPSAPNDVRRSPFWRRAHPPLSLRPFAPAHCISARCHPVRPSGVLVLQLAQGTAAVAHLFIFIFLAFISTLPRPSQFSNGQQKTRKKMSDSIFSSPFFSRNDVIYPVPSWPSAQHAPTLIFSRTLQRPPPLPSCVILHLFLLAHK